MTLGEKIIHLRLVNNISQDELAKILNTSRQSLSKWENDEVSPTVTILKKICDLFKVTADELICDDIVIDKSHKINILNENNKLKYFGTDGFRGEANEILNSDKAYKIGRFLGWYYSNLKYNNTRESRKVKIVIGKDTRLSSDMFESSIASGAMSSGADIYLLHVTTTPSISYIVKCDSFDCGVMITASHNQYYDNGIKLIDSNGEKLSDDVLLLVEAYLEGKFDVLGLSRVNDIPFAKKEKIGQIYDYTLGRDKYINYLKSLVKKDIANIRIAIDTANGAASNIAKEVFESSYKNVSIINNDPNGLNINLGCGSTHIDTLAKYVKENKFDVGFSFDGDADRCICVDSDGDIIDGDKIMYILALKLKREGKLFNNTLVTTIMSNSGLEKALKEKDIDMIRTQVGDRFVYEKMVDGNYSLGGEQSGHIIIKEYASTGDGILTALMILNEMIDENEKLSMLASKVQVLPQKLKNVYVTNKDTVMNDGVVLNISNEINKELLGHGRVLLRKSGTEPLIRIMVECDDDILCDKSIGKIYNVIKKRGYVINDK